MSPAEEVLRRLHTSYHPPLEIARGWLRQAGSRRADALDLLTGLRRRYPHVLAIGNELVLALIEEDRHSDALKELARLEHDFREVDEETRCRWGRVYKEEGDRAWRIGDPVTAESRYQKALEQYELGCGLRQGHYPGINRATILLLLAALARRRGDDVRCKEYSGRAATAADDVLARRAAWPTDRPDDNVWHPATRGEAYLLKCCWPQAAEEYRAALAEPNVQPFHRSSIGKQARRILDAWAVLDVTPAAPFDHPGTLFGEATG